MSAAILCADLSSLVCCIRSLATAADVVGSGCPLTDPQRIDAVVSDLLACIDLLAEKAEKLAIC